MGPVSFIDGSHLWEADSPTVKELREGKTFITADFDGLQQRLKESGHPFSIVPAVMRKGQASFHHCKLFHGSLANKSPQPRRNLIVHMQDGENRFREAYDNAGDKISYNTDKAARKLPNGYPDYRDPDLFPTIWSAPDRVS
jgi:ectoine hydroxylase-related dioxygenase (phytanoyl-CoA dioxygenase family)